MQVAIAGATGAVGAEFLRILSQRRFPVDDLVLLASERSEGKTLTFRGRSCPVRRLAKDSFAGVRLALFSCGAARSVEFAPAAVAAGAVVVDNSSAFRMEKEVPLVVPEVNAGALRGHRGIIANPNCSTIQMVVALWPLHQAFRVERVVVSTYQAASGAGARAMAELEEQAPKVLRGEKVAAKVFPHQIAFNLFPQVDVFLDNGYTKEEMKMVHETRKIMGEPDLPVTATCVRVPVLRAHSEAVNVELSHPVTREEVVACLSTGAGIEIMDDPKKSLYPMPFPLSGTDAVYVGRIRVDISHPQGVAMWVVADQLRKGAALNAVQIAEAMQRQGLL
ncbi:MAG: aspartate-semialdehyde dehydrogenase [Planctomycetes bacterium]|nr:aspartate-semialdehyde dehydrogenase [Planctomycetota bacterium]